MSVISIKGLERKQQTFKKTLVSGSTYICFNKMSAVEMSLVKVREGKKADFQNLTRLMSTLAAIVWGDSEGTKQNQVGLSQPQDHKAGSQVAGVVLPLKLY